MTNASATDINPAEREVAWKELINIPSWISIPARDTRRRETVLNRISRLKRFSMDTLYWLDQEFDRRAGVDRNEIRFGSNLFVLHKLLFAVPATDDTVMGHWPLTQLPNGKFVLDGDLKDGGGNVGLGEKRAVQFRRLEAKYGIRKEGKKQDSQ
jgi:hypothetical protein